MKFRIFHGDADDVVTVKGSREAYKALKAAGADVEYIEFPGCNHGSWNPAFNLSLIHILPTNKVVHFI